MIHQGALVSAEHARSVSAERIAKGDFKDIIHLHLRKSAIMEEHVANTNAVLLVISGEIVFSASGKHFTLKSGDFLNFDAHMLHAIEAMEESHVLLIK